MTPQQPVTVDLATLIRNATSTGPQWGHECDDMDFTLMRWDARGAVAPHVNHEVDVLMVVLEGEGELVVEGEAMALRGGMGAVIPKGHERSVRSASESFAYLNVHKRRRRLMPV